MRFVAYVFSVSCFSLVTALAEAEKPNFLFILADDLGYGDLGCYGAPDIATPNLDRIASEGIRFTDAYANGAICSPTRIAFLTGRYQQRFGMENALYYQEFGRGLPEGGEPMLFDVDADPGETTDLAARHPEIIERLRTRLDRWERDVEPR